MRAGKINNINAFLERNNREKWSAVSGKIVQGRSYLNVCKSFGLEGLKQAEPEHFNIKIFSVLLSDFRKSDMAFVFGIENIFASFIKERNLTKEKSPSRIC